MKHFSHIHKCAAALSLFAALAGTAEASEFRIRARLMFLDNRTSGATTLNVNKGAARVKYELWDDDPAGDVNGDDFLGDGYTNSEGRVDHTFEFDEWWPFGEGAHPDVYIVFKTQNTRFKVKASGLFDPPYTMSTSTRSNLSGGTTDFGNVSIASGTTTHKALLIHQSMNEMYDVVNSSDITWGDQIEVTFPGTLCNGPSCTFLDRLNITLASAGSGFTVMHEYGHALNWRRWEGIMPAANYCLGQTSSSGCGHSWGSREDAYAAFIEGWGDYVAARGLGHIGENTLAPGFTGLEFNPSNSLGIQNEHNVASVLNDIIDFESDNNAGPGIDQVDRTLAESVTVLDHFSLAEVLEPPDIRDYIDEYREVTGGVTFAQWVDLMANNWITYP